MFGQIPHPTYRIVLQLRHPRPGVGIVNVYDRVVFLLLLFISNEKNKEQASAGVSGLAWKREELNTLNPLTQG